MVDALKFSLSRRTVLQAAAVGRTQKKDKSYAESAEPKHLSFLRILRDLCALCVR